MPASFTADLGTAANTASQTQRQTVQTQIRTVAQGDQALMERADAGFNAMVQQLRVNLRRGGSTTGD